MSTWEGVRVIAAREIAVKLRDKAFLGSTLFMLLLVAAATALPIVLQQRVPEFRVAVQGDVAAQVVDLAAQLGEQAQTAAAEAPGPLGLLGLGELLPAQITTVDVEPGEDLDRLVDNGDVHAAVAGDDVADLEVVGDVSVSPELEALIRAAAARLQVAVATEAAGLTPQEVAELTDPAPPTVRLLDPEPPGTVPPQLLSIIFAFLFYLSVLTFGMAIAQSVVEEKQSRVVELLVAALPVRTLLAGKVVGSTLMALGQIVLVVGGGLVGVLIAGERALLTQLLAASGWFVLFFLLGFVMLACLWAVAGSLAARVEDLNATTVVMQVLVIVPFFASVFATDPGTQKLLSYVPFTAPLMMPARVLQGTVEPWEPYVAALVVLVTAVLFVLLGARLYANSVMHTSGRLRAVQAWRGVDG